MAKTKMRKGLAVMLVLCMLLMMLPVNAFAADSTISPTTATFDKNTSSADYKDIAVTMTLNGNTLVAIKKEYLATQAVGNVVLTFDFSAGADPTLTVTVSDSTPQDSTISPTTATFDKNTSSADYKDVVVTMTLNGNTLTAIKNGETALVENTDYTVADNVVTIKKEYLATQAVGNVVLTFDFSAGADPTLTVTVSDSTPQDSTISPTTATFDKNTSSVDYKDVVVTMTLNGNTLTAIKNGETALVENTDYTVADNVVTIKKEYLATQAVGNVVLTFDFSAGADPTLTVTVSDSTPQDSTISPTTATFDKNTSSVDYKDVVVTMTLNGNTLTAIKNGETALVENTDYTVADNVVTIKKEYLATQAVGNVVLTFDFSAGADPTLTVTVSDSTPQDSTISPTTATFDKNTSSADYKDIAVTMTLNGNTLVAIKNGGTALTENTDYTVADNVVTIKKEYLAAQAEGTTTLTFEFSAGNPATLTVTVKDTTPAQSTYKLTYTGLAESYTAGSLVDVNGKTQAEINAAVAAAIQGLTPINVTLATDVLGQNGYEAVRIAPVNAGSNVQLWAKDTAGNWYDINVVGWGPEQGFELSAQYDVTTAVYFLSNQAGQYNLNVNLVNVKNNDVITSAICKVTVNPAPVTVTGITVKTEPTKVTYTEGEQLDLTGLVVTLTKSDSTTEDVAFADFATKGITTNPGNGTTLAITDTAVTITHTESGKSVTQVITVNPAPVDKTALTAAITAEIGEDHNNPVYVLTETDYTAESWTAYTDAIAAAIAVEADANATQEDVNAAVTAIETAKAGLVRAYTLTIGTESDGGAGKTRTITIGGAYAANLDGKYLVVQFTEGTGVDAKVSVVMISPVSTDITVSYQVAGTTVEAWLTSGMPDLIEEDMGVITYANATTNVD